MTVPPEIPLWAYAAAGAFGGLAIELISILGAIQRCKNLPWRQDGEAGPGALLISMLIRLVLGVGVALALGQSGEIAGLIAAVGAGAGAPLILEQLAKQAVGQVAGDPPETPAPAEAQPPVPGRGGKSIPIEPNVVLAQAIESYSLTPDEQHELRSVLGQLFSLNLNEWDPASTMEGLVLAVRANCAQRDYRPGIRYYERYGPHGPGGHEYTFGSEQGRGASPIERYQPGGYAPPEPGYGSTPGPPIASGPEGGDGPGAEPSGSPPGAKVRPWDSEVRSHRARHFQTFLAALARSTKAFGGTTKL